MERNRIQAQGAALLARDGGCAVWQLRSESGEGTITACEVFPGVMLSFNDLHMGYYDCDFSAGRELLVIDHCREGRMEYCAGRDALAYQQAGDLKLDRRRHHTGCFPTSHYHGLTAALDAELAERGTITGPQAALAVMLSMSMVGSLAKLEVFSENMRQVKFTVEQMQELLDMPELTEPARRAETDGTGVELKNVRFSCTGKADGEVLHGVDLRLPQGSFTAPAGPSGGGKSTVAKLIARFWDVTAGSVTVGGVNVKDMPLSQLSGLVSFVAQDNFLFRCSLLENIRLGDPSASDEAVMAAARAAQCDEFIQKLPQGYDTPAGEVGKQLSGGERQRIAIARMILKNAPIVILDEATAFTDPENEDKLQRSLAELTRGRTILTIAHRLATIENADQILVMNDGRVVQRGTHAQLMAQEGTYRRFVEIRQRAEGWHIA